MVTTVRSLGLSGISGYEVSVECMISGGLPAFDVVGLPDAAVKESRERVRAAIKNCGASSLSAISPSIWRLPVSAKRVRCMIFPFSSAFWLPANSFAGCPRMRPFSVS